MRNLKLDEFKNYKYLSGLELSPDGKYACFVVHQCNVDDNKYDSNLWLYNLETNNYFQLTTLNKESNFFWQQDGEHIIFSTVRDHKAKKRLESGEKLTQYYRINIRGGEAHKFFEVPLQVTSIRELDSHKFILTAIYNKNEKDLVELNDEERAAELKKRKEEKDYQVIEEIPFWENGGGFTNQKRNRLYIFNLKTGEYKPISDETLNVESFDLSKDKTKVAYSVSFFNSGMLNLTSKMLIYHIEEGVTEQLLEQGKYNCGYANFIDDNNILLVATDGKKYGLNENRKIFILNIQTKDITCLTPDLDKGLYNSVGSDCRYGASKSYKIDEGYFYFTSTEKESSFINKLNIKTKSIERLTKAKGSIDGFAVRNNTILFIGLRDLFLQELYQVDENREIPLTSFNNWIVDEIKVSKPEPLSIEPLPGIAIDGWVMKPVDFEEKKKYPAVLNIHGGPKTVYGTVFYHEMQYWANEGYFVFFCNPRGSDGKGNDFADIRGKYGTIDYDDIMAFTDEVLKQYPNIDSERVGVTGGSYGGFMTNWIIGHTTRFKVAASQRSISNWIAKFGITDIGYFFVEDQQGATPWSDVDKLWWHSPMKYVDRVKTPTLIIHSDEDFRCWVNEGYQMFTSLKFHGVEARMCIFKGENHELSRSGKPQARIRRLKEITNWFDKFLK